jgi:ribosome-binding factor A
MKYVYGMVMCATIIAFGLVQSKQSKLFFQGEQGTQSLDEFVVSCGMPLKDSEKFSEYYREAIEKNSKKSADARQKIRKELQNQALCALEVKKPEWAKIVKCQSDMKEAKVFLTRYGMLEDFYKTEAQKTGNTWSKIVTFGKNVATKSSKKIASLKQKIQRKSQVA